MDDFTLNDIKNNSYYKSIEWDLYKLKKVYNKDYLNFAIHCILDELYDSDKESESIPTNESISDCEPPKPKPKRVRSKRK